MPVRPRSVRGSSPAPLPSWLYAVLILVPVLLAASACSNLQAVAPPTTTTTTTGTTLKASPVRVVLSPDNSNIQSGGMLQFTAFVQNTSNTGIVWSSTGGAINNQGLLSAPKVSAIQKFVVTATSVADASANSSVNVTVVPFVSMQISTSQLDAAKTGSSYSATLSATGGQTPYQWSIASGALPSGLQLNASAGIISGVPSQVGNFPFTLLVKDAAGHQATQALGLLVSSNVVGNYDGPAELPRVYLQTSMADTPATAKTITVNAGGDFQAAINNAQCGDTISLQAGASFPGVFYFPKKACDDQHWIVIRTSAPDSGLPAEGTRITPCYAGVSSLPGRPSFHCASTRNVMAQLMFGYQTGYGPIVFQAGANHYRFVGLEVTRPKGTPVVSDLITPDKDAPADHIILDRMWIHGTPQDETTRGVYLSGVTFAAVIDSFFSDFHCISITGSCTDSQAIGGGGRDFPAGPFKIVDNFLEAAGENILFGGGESTTTPADIEIRQNHFFKPLFWMRGQKGFVGGKDGHPFVVKNDFELKNGQRVLFEGNIVEYSWGGFSQFGYSLMITPKNQSGPNGTNLCPLCRVTDVTVRYNTISHAAAGINMANAISDNGGIASGGGNYSIHDITIDDIDSTLYQGGGPLVLVMNGWPTHILGSIRINHITGFGDPSKPVLSVGNDTSLPKMQDFTYTNNLVFAGAFPVWSSGGRTNCAYETIPIDVIRNCFQPYSFVKNAFIASPANYPPSKWPAGNYFPATENAVGFVDFHNGNGGNYQLLPSSPYKNAGTDGKDLGADIGAILSATANSY